MSGKWTVDGWQPDKANGFMREEYDMPSGMFILGSTKTPTKVDIQQWMQDNQKFDDSAVHAPSHYALGELGIEAIDVIQASLGPEGFKAYCLGNVLKYVLRHDKKNGKEDLEKALKYLEWALNGK